MSDKTKARVSYILTTLNRADFLERALQNAREYLTPEDELLVIDGGSTDRTQEVVRAHRDIISEFVSEPDKGEGHAFNKGVLLARGEYIKLLADDDTLYANAVKQILKVFRDHPELDALVCGGEKYRCDPAGQQEALLHYLWLPPEARLKDNFGHLLDRYNFVICSMGLWIRRRIIAQVGLFNPKFLPVDAEYVARMIEQDVHVKFLSVNSYRLRVHPQSLSVTRRSARRDLLQVLFRMRLWDEAFEGYYSRDDIIETLGLVRWRHLLRLNLAAGLYACSRRRWVWLVLKSAAFVGRKVAAPLGFLIKGRRRSRALDPERKSGPIWDGSLR